MYFSSTYPRSTANVGPNGAGYGSPWQRPGTGYFCMAPTNVGRPFRARIIRRRLTHEVALGYRKSAL